MFKFFYKKFKRYFKNYLSRSFTLIELMVVLSIISLISSIVFASLSQVRMQGRDTRRLSEIKQISIALELYYADKGKYPDNQFDVPGTFLYADSRHTNADPCNLPVCNAGVPFWSNLMGFLVPTYLPTIPLPPNNNGGDGAMCANCDEYRYAANSYGRGYSICTYVASDKNKNGSNGSGPYFCIQEGCGVGSSFSICQN